MNTDQPIGVSLEEAARLLSVSPRTIRRLADRGEVQTFLVATRRLVVRSSLIALVDRGGSA